MKVSIDNRPLGVLLLLKGLRPFFFISLALFLWYLLSLPQLEGLTVQGQRAMIIFFVALILWVTQALPLAVTSIFALIAVPFLGVLETGEAYALFGNEAVFFILGAFILAAAIMHSGLSSRIALIILKKFGTTPKNLALSIYLLSAVLSFVMSEHAVAAMLFPIVLEIAKALDLRPGVSGYGKLLFFSLAWGCVIGGVATFLGGARVPLAAGILKETSGEGIGFFEYSAAVLPAVFVMLAVGFFILVKVHKPDIDSVEKARKVLTDKNRELGRIGYVEYMVGGLMVITILCWMFLGGRFGLANIALGAVVVLFVFRLVRWKDVEEYVNWGIVLMYGGAITLGAALAKSGAAEWLIDLTLGSMGLQPLVLVGFISLISLFLSEGMSNSAVVAVLMPLAAGLSREFHLDPKMITYTIAIPAGLAFTLPMSTPANAIAISSGYLRVRDMVKTGILASISAWIIFNLMVWFYWPLVGIRG